MSFSSVVDVLKLVYSPLLNCLETMKIDPIFHLTIDLGRFRKTKSMWMDVNNGYAGPSEYICVVQH